MDRAEPAGSPVRGRLTVLLSHLDKSGCCSEFSPFLRRSAVSAQAIQQPVNGFGGVLTVVDERTGKKYEVPVSEEGTVRATDLKKVRLFNRRA